MSPIQIRSMHFAALALSTVFLAACVSEPITSVWGSYQYSRAILLDPLDFASLQSVDAASPDGVVRVNFQLNADGHPENIRVEAADSAKAPALAIMQAMGGWRFLPVPRVSGRRYSFDVPYGPHAWTARYRDYCAVGNARVERIRDLGARVSFYPDCETRLLSATDNRNCRYRVYQLLPVYPDTGRSGVGSNRLAEVTFRLDGHGFPANVDVSGVSSLATAGDAVRTALRRWYFEAQSPTCSNADVFDVHVAFSDMVSGYGD